MWFMKIGLHIPYNIFALGNTAGEVRYSFFFHSLFSILFPLLLLSSFLFSVCTRIFNFFLHFCFSSLFFTFVFFISVFTFKVFFVYSLITFFRCIFIPSENLRKNVQHVYHIRSTYAYVLVSKCLYVCICVWIYV